MENPWELALRNMYELVSILFKYKVCLKYSFIDNIIHWLRFTNILRDNINRPQINISTWKNYFPVKNNNKFHIKIILYTSNNKFTRKKLLSTQNTYVLIKLV